MEDLTLAELFALADEYDHYLTPEEIDERDRQLAEATAELAEVIGYPELEA